MERERDTEFLNVGLSLGFEFEGERVGRTKTLFDYLNHKVNISLKMQHKNHYTAPKFANEYLI